MIQILFTLALGAPSALRADQPELPSCVVQLDPHARERRSTERQRYKAEYGDVRVTTVAENDAWIATKDAPDGYHYFTLEIMLRDLNSRFKDKELATAIVHHALGTMAPLARTLSKLLLQSDFKALRLAYPESAEATAKLWSAYDQVVALVRREQRERQVLRREDDITDLIHAADGPSADWADLLAKLSRGGTRATPADAEAARLAAVAVQDWFKARFARSPLSDGDIPKRRVFDLAKKFRDPRELAEVLNHRFPRAGVTAFDAARLYDYLERISVFTSGLHQRERIVVSLKDAALGGASLDFRGMNAANLQVTARAVREGRDVDQVLRLARAGERAVTAEFAAKIRKLKALGPFTCSGDDCVYHGLLSAAAKADLLNALNANPMLREVRVAFIPAGVGLADERHLLAGHGESIESILRVQLERKLAPGKLDRLTFAVDMRTTRLNQGEVDLLVGGGPLGARDRATIAETFRAAVALHNAAVTAEGEAVARYRPRLRRI